MTKRTVVENCGEGFGTDGIHDPMGVQKDEVQMEETTRGDCECQSTYQLSNHSHANQTRFRVWGGKWRLLF